MKTPTTKLQRKTFQELINSGNDLITKQDREAGLHSSLVVRKGEREKKIANLEKSGLSTPEARAELVDARTELEGIERQIASETERLSSVAMRGKANAELTAWLRNAGFEIGKFANPLVTDYVSDRAKRVRLLCACDAEATGLVYQTAEYKSLCRVFNRDFGGIGRTHIGVVKEAVSLLEQILSGEVPFNFDPKL